MYGLVNKSLQEMVERQLGSAAWTDIRCDAGIDTEVFISLDGYPDDVTYSLVEAIGRRTGAKADVFSGISLLAT
jgi:peptidoglycan hydrolase-like protein with peptidoglycan-binding domain